MQRGDATNKRVCKAAGGPRGLELNEKSMHPRSPSGKSLSEKRREDANESGRLGGGADARGSL